MSYQTNNITSGFIDLATQGDPEKYLYGMRPNTTAPQLYQGQISTRVEANLSKNEHEDSFNISKAGDWLEKLMITVFVEVEPNVNLKNLAHNVFEEISLSVDGEVIWRVDPFSLDYLANFIMSPSALERYRECINLKAEQKAGFLTLPLPFKNPIPICAIDSTVKLNYDLALPQGVNKVEVQSVKAIYRIVSNEARKNTQIDTQHIIMESYETLKPETLNFSCNTTPQFDMRFSGTVQALFFAVKDRTELSQYYDDMGRVSMSYEETTRFHENGHYFTHIQPHFHADYNNGEPIGMYCFAEGKITDQRMSGSTNMSHLTNVAITPNLNQQMRDRIIMQDDYAELERKKYIFMMSAQTKTILEIQNGKLRVFREGELNNEKLNIKFLNGRDFLDGPEMPIYKGNGTFIVLFGKTEKRRDFYDLSMKFQNFQFLQAKIANDVQFCHLQDLYDLGKQRIEQVLPNVPMLVVYKDEKIVSVCKNMDCTTEIMQKFIEESLPTAETKSVGCTGYTGYAETKYHGTNPTGYAETKSHGTNPTGYTGADISNIEICEMRTPGIMGPLGYDVSGIETFNVYQPDYTIIFSNKNPSIVFFFSSPEDLKNYNFVELSKRINLSQIKIYAKDLSENVRHTKPFINIPHIFFYNKGRPFREYKDIQNFNYENMKKFIDETFAELQKEAVEKTEITQLNSFSEDAIANIPLKGSGRFADISEEPIIVEAPKEPSASSCIIS